MKLGKNLDPIWKSYAAAICTGVALYVFLEHINVVGSAFTHLYRFISPVFSGLVIAYILNPLAKLIRRYVLPKIKNEKIAWRLSCILTIVLVLVLLTILMVALIPQIIESVITLINNFGVYSQSLDHLLETINTFAAQFNYDLSDITEFGQNALSKAATTISENSGDLISTVTGIGTSIFNGVISFIISIYFLLDKYRLETGLRDILKLIFSEKQYPSISSFWRRCNRILVRYIGCDLMDGLLIGIINAIFMLFARMPYVALISVIIGVTNLAPTFGPIVGAIIGSFILVLVNPWWALAFLVFTLILQTMDGYVIKPKLFGDSLGVPSIWILVSIIVFGRMFGVVGILIAIPIAAIVDFIYNDYILSKLRKRQEKRKTVTKQD